MGRFLGIDCGSVSLNLVLLNEASDEPLCVYRRIRSSSLQTFVEAVDELTSVCDRATNLESALVTGSGRELFSRSLGIPAINEITAHATGVLRVNPDVRTVIEVGGQDSKFIKIEPIEVGAMPRVSTFRMNEVCAAGTGAFLDEQADRLGIPVESFGSLALQSEKPIPIAGRCAVFAKTDMIHQAQEGTPVPDILLGLAFALVRNYVATLIRGDSLDPVVALQGGVMHNQAVVRAFRELLGLPQDKIVIPPHFEVLGAMGCAMLAGREGPIRGLSLQKLRDAAEVALRIPPQRSFFPQLDATQRREPPAADTSKAADSAQGPLVMGIDVGSVSVKGVVVDGTGQVIRQDYRLSRSLPLETAHEVTRTLTEGGLKIDAVSVTGSGRYLIGRLLQADVIVNEIIAQAQAAVRIHPDVETVVEIGGQDSKWISLEQGRVKDFEMNRVCAAGTGSFLMAQARRLGLPMGREFSDAAFGAARPADLGNRCTVFMESDLIHHQNSGASVNDLAAGVCLSISQNYVERVANHKPFGKRVMFLGGVAATDAVRVALEQQTGSDFYTPAFYHVSGALGAALKGLEALAGREIEPGKKAVVSYDPSKIVKQQFQCRGCSNECRIRKYAYEKQTVFNGGLCDRWEIEKVSAGAASENDPLTFRAQLLQHELESTREAEMSLGMVRSPQFYEWFPFWKSFCEELGIGLKVPSSPNRKQFQRGGRFLRVETCLPMKVLAGQVDELSRQGVRQIFHPVILNEDRENSGQKPLVHCPYVQACPQLFRGVLDLEWLGPAVSLALDPDSFRREHLRFARGRGFSRESALQAMEAGLDRLNGFRDDLRERGEQFLNSLTAGEKALVVLGKPYHVADDFLNMNLAGLVRHLGVKAMPSDLFPLTRQGLRSNVPWKYQSDMTQVARAIASEPNLFPVFITFFGCGPDPFTLRHLEEALDGKPLLILEMDEHSSRAGIATRLEAFLERVQKDSGRQRKSVPVQPESDREEDSVEQVEATAPGSLFERARTYLQNSWDESGWSGPERAGSQRSPKPEVLYIPYLGDHSYAVAAAARYLDIDARILPPPDEESHRLGRPHAVGGECHPYVLVLGDYLKLAQSLSPEQAVRARFGVVTVDACRLGQYPVYIEHVRRQLGLSTGVVFDMNHGLATFGLSQRNRLTALLKTWEALNAYDILAKVFYEVRASAIDPAGLGQLYTDSCLKLFEAACGGRVQAGLEEVLHDLSSVPVGDSRSKPEVVVTGDYYTRGVEFANNDVYREVEALGGALRPPPTISDCFKMTVLRDSIWSVLNGQAIAAARNGLLYMMMAMFEFRVKGSKPARRALEDRLDIAGLNLWRGVSAHAETRLPAGITAPISTVLQEVEHRADGILNLMTLNCAFGTVVTAALSRVLKQERGIPMLTLIYDGLKKTNEKTRLEAFMEQVRDHFEYRRRSKEKKSA